MKSRLDPTKSIVLLVDSSENTMPKTIIPTPESACDASTTWFRNDARNGLWCQVAAVRNKKMAESENAFAAQPPQVVTRMTEMATKSRTWMDSTRT